MRQPASRTRVVSLDAEGTLVTHTFSRTIWREVVPALYGRARGLSADEAAARVFAEYETIGPGREEWYDINYWFRRFDLGDPRVVMEEHRALVHLYPEVPEVLRCLNGCCRLVVASSTPAEFLEPLLRDVRHLFDGVFSSTSQYGRLKDEQFFRRLAGTLNVDPGAIVHVGDNWERDYVSASAAGCVALFLDREAATPGGLRTLRELPPRLGIRESSQVAGDGAAAV